MVAKPKNIDEYLAALSDDKRAALERLRKIIRAAVPKGRRVHQLPTPGFPTRRQMLGVVRRSRESLRDLRRAGRPQGRTQGLRHQQGHDPFPSR